MPLPSVRTAVTVARATGAPAALVTTPTIAPSSAAKAAGNSSAPASATSSIFRRYRGIRMESYLYNTQRRPSSGGPPIVRSDATAARPNGVKKFHASARADRGSCANFADRPGSGSLHECNSQTGAALCSGRCAGPGPGTLAGAQTAPVPPAVEKAAGAYITRAALEAPIRFLSSDLLEGRGPATRADQLVRLYLQTRLEGMGLQPAFAGGEWQQPFDIVGIRSAFPATWSFAGKSGHVDLAWRADY